MRNLILLFALLFAVFTIGAYTMSMIDVHPDSWHVNHWRQVHDDPFFQQQDPRERIIAIVLMADEYDIAPAEELVLNMVTEALNEVFITGTDLAEAHCDEMMNLVVDRQVTKTWANCNALLQDIEQEYRVRVALMEDW